MRKRLLIGLLSAGLVGAMLPGVALAKGTPDKYTLGHCLKDGTVVTPGDPDSAFDYHVGKAGDEDRLLWTASVDFADGYNTAYYARGETPLPVMTSGWQCPRP